MRATLAALAFLAAIETASAASMGIVSFDGQNPIISMSGPIEPIDDHKFEEFAQALRTPAIVRLSSVGGNTMAALAIGRAIARAGYSTYVADNELCASACGLIWLAGRQRYSGPTARIGLHATYLTQGGKDIETSPGNALVGKYLGELGYQDDFVVYATSAPPQGMFWLNRTVTERFNIAWDMRDQDMATLNTLDIPPQGPVPILPGPLPIAKPSQPGPPLQNAPLTSPADQAPEFIPLVRPPAPQKPLLKLPTVPRRADSKRPMRTLQDDFTEFFFGSPQQNEPKPLPNPPARTKAGFANSDSPSE